MESDEEEESKKVHVNIGKGAFDLGNDFTDLEQAKGNPKINVWDDIKDLVWDNVVILLVRFKKAEGTYGRRRGTGFVFTGPNIGKAVMTNYHVVKDHVPECPIRVGFFYDGPRNECVEREFRGQIEYYSRDGSVNKENRDFAVLSVQNIPDKAKGISLEYGPVGGTHAPFYFRDTDKTHEKGMHEGIVIGHPRGGYKRISIVTFKAAKTDDNKEFFVERQYSKEGTRQGSSGSPVLTNNNLSGMNRGKVYVLHYASGAGVDIARVLQSIREQRVARGEQDYAGDSTSNRLFENRVIEHDAEDPDSKRSYENCVFRGCTLKF